MRKNLTAFNFIAVVWTVLYLITLLGNFQTVSVPTGEVGRGTSHCNEQLYLQFT